MNITSGARRVSGSISYAPQEPWVFSGSVRQNILFGRPMDGDRYARTVRACALEPDLAAWAHGDRTLVGEKGVALSGGQKARVSLARAVYREADVYLLDDPLSAVDARVVRLLFRNCIRRAKLRFHLVNRLCISYRVFQLLVDWIGLTWILNVPPSARFCLG